MSQVALVRTKGRLRDSLKDAIDLIGGFGKITSPVLIKPNICTISDGTGHSVTDPNLVKHLVELILSHDKNISIKIVESDSQSKYADEAFKKFGYTDFVGQLQDRGSDVRLVNLSKSLLKELDFQGTYFKNAQLPIDVIDEHYFISVAIAKTHYLTKITGTLKNQFGLLPQKNQASYHSDINGIILDFNEIVKPKLCIIDARVGIEGWNGPKTHKMNLLIAGKEPASVDSVMAQIVGFNPKDVDHLVAAANQGMGVLEPDIVGEDLQSVLGLFNSAT
jgi:uncharacterized protein (DUF362 family)